ncbi:hypothetical protein D9619_011791 [Psilocybe cf. subviscida]|uniref:NACHT domain-containing protein n=1 Tax=Psilocybe cf. subviscida TaxID=2480587 RepID=A0A8H5EW03_9AGAR|nr:hypothetical protein D9619_011791 [Psilocybe cf. subviscida]
MISTHWATWSSVPRYHLLHLCALPAMLFRRRKKPVPRHNGTESQSVWKRNMAVAFTATEKALVGLPIPAAKTCISLVLKVINSADVAADNERVLKQLHARYQDLKEFLLCISPDTPKAVQDDVNGLDLKLKGLAGRWEPFLTKKPRKRDTVLKLFTTPDDRDMLKEFVAETDQAINDFLLNSEVQNWMLAYREIVKNRQIAVLSSMPRAHNAPYDSVREDRAKSCLQGTRQLVLTAIMEWAHGADPSQPPIFWLDSLAGIGKTTIAHTIASRLDENQQLGGSFFFLRSDNLLKDANLVFPTLAFQLSEINPLVRKRLVEVLKNDPRCVNQSLATQFGKLILDPMSATPLSKPLILILDALDECQPSHDTTVILETLVRNIKKIPFLRVLITSRPKAHVSKAFGIAGGRLVHRKLVLHENTEVQRTVKQDIRLYLKTSLQEIWNRNKTGGWPSEEDLEALVRQSGNLFIYATTVIRFFEGTRSLHLDMQLRNILKLQEKHAPNADIEPYTHLDHLYLAILDTAFAIMDTKDKHFNVYFHHIVGGVVLMKNALPVEALAAFLGDYDVNAIKSTLSYLRSIFIVPEVPSQTLRTYHFSFFNFITNPSRCTNCDAYIDPPKHQRYLFLRCLNTMKRFFGPPIQSQRRLMDQQDTVGSVDSQDVDHPSSSWNTKQGESQSKAGGDIDDEDSDDFYKSDASMTPEALGDLTDPEERTEEQRLVSELEHFLTYYLSQWLDRRTKLTLSTVGATRIKLAQETFDIMHNVHCWMAANIDSQRSWGMKQILKADAREAFARLFPQAKGNYTLGARLLKDQLWPSTPNSSAVARLELAVKSSEDTLCGTVQTHYIR